MSRQLLIVVEGPNKSGKSTLIRHIVENFPERNFEVIKCSQPLIDEKGNHAFEEYSSILDRIESNPDKNYILDRFYFGSFVYGPIYRGENDFTFSKFFDIEERVLKLQYLFILAIASKLFIKKKFVEEKEEYAKIELIGKEIDLFEKIARTSRLNINYHRIPKHDLLKDERIVNIIKLYE